MLFAQSLGEYGGGGGGMAAELVASMQAGANWVGLSLREHPILWIVGGVLLGAWLLKRR